ncbi:MAG: DUF192 domain-containing protein [Chloroflexota bacterium]
MSAPAVAIRTTDGRTVARDVEQALGFWGRFMGLMGRAALPAGEGLYLPDTSIHMFFMRFPIDALFVTDPDGNGRRRVVAVRPDLPPWRGIVMPVKGAKGVVELPAGTLAAARVQPGDEVVFEPIGGAASS